jgi:tRNA(Ile)-lysidine synthase
MDIFNLKQTKNLLAFSGGVDSTALFFMLLEKNIDFDIAIIHYNIRDEAIFEIEYAKNLAKKYDKNIFITKFNQKFNEHNAREFRYNFFEQLIQKYKYEVLLTAHQLNDKCEWFLMQFTKGVGAKELYGMNEIEYKKNYILYRPLLKYSKDDLLQYLNQNNIKYFIDKTNFDTKYKRNYFRDRYCNELIKNYQQGIAKSFKFLQKDIQIFKSLYHIEKIDDIFKIAFVIDNDTLKIQAIDEILKKEFNIILTYKTKLEILRLKDLVISHKIVISFYKNYVFIAPKTTTKLDKKFKEYCRVNKIPKHLRNILYKYQLNIT